MRIGQGSLQRKEAGESILQGTTVRKSVIILCMALLAACVSAPIQEMSDARQAIHAAREVVDAKAPVLSQERFARASELMQAAESQLRDGDFGKARQLAMSAKLLAIEARERVVGDAAN